jgi:hypothetical protein
MNSEKSEGLSKKKRQTRAGEPSSFLFDLEAAKMGKGLRSLRCHGQPKKTNGEGEATRPETSASVQNSEGPTKPQGSTVFDRAN